MSTPRRTPRTDGSAKPAPKKRKPRGRTSAASKPDHAAHERNPSRDAAQLGIGSRPSTPAQLHAWLRRVLGLTVPRAPMVRNHSAPFDYLCHVFFEGEVPARKGAKPIAEPEPEPETEPAAEFELQLVQAPGSPPGVPVASADPESLSAPTGSEIPARTPIHASHDGQPAPTTPNELPHATPPAESSPPAAAGSQSSPADCIVWANRGGGKTFLGAVATVLDLVFKPTIEVRILAGSLDQAKRMHAHLRRLFEIPLLAELLAEPIKERRIRLTNGSELELLAASQASVRGTRVQRLRCDEVELFRADVWEAAQLTTRSKQCGDVYVRGSVECLSTMHRPYGLMSTLVREARAGSRTVFRWSLVDVLSICGPEHACETCVLRPECRGRAKKRPVEQSGHVEIADAVRMKSRVGEATWDAEMLCLRPKRHDMVYPEFDPRVHVVDEDPCWAAGIAGPGVPWSVASVLRAGPEPVHPGRIPEPWRTGLVGPPECRWVCGMDFGFRAPTAIVWGVVDPEGTLWIVDERVQTEVTLDEHMEAIERGWGDGLRAARGIEGRPEPGTPRGWPRPLWIGVDPAGQQANDQTGRSAVSAMKAAGLNVVAGRLRTEPGIALVRARLKPAAPKPVAAEPESDGTGAGSAPAPETPAHIRGRPAVPPRLFIHRRCAKLIESLEQYHYDPRRPQSATPMKDGPDHAADALRYLILNLDRPRTSRMSEY